VFQDLPLGANAALFAVAAAIVWYAGSKLSRYADRISDISGLGQAAIGVVLLGSITSLPEIAVAITATLDGEPALSVADVLGSAAINLLILALADAALGRDALTSTPGSTGVMLQGLFGIVLFTIVISAAFVGDVLVGGIGVSSWALLIGYGLALRILVKNRDRSAWVPKQRYHRPQTPHDPERGSGRTLAWRTTAAAVAITAAGFSLARSGSALAEQTGLGASFVGGVFLALATSLPEISTVLGAVRLGRYEMAIGGIFGTNLFNVMVIVLVDALHPGDPVLASIGTFAGFGALLAMLLTAVFLIGMVERRDRTVFRMGFDSLAALAVYVAGLFVMYRIK
jgi:cation:H+ antiporter